MHFTRGVIATLLRAPLGPVVGLAVVLAALSSGCRARDLSAGAPFDGAPTDAGDHGPVPPDRGAGFPAVSDASGPSEPSLDAGTFHEVDAGDAGIVDGVAVADAGRSREGGSAAQDGGNVDDSAVEQAAEPLEGWFVDAVAGNDANDGRSERTPFATLARLRQSPLETGDLIYLARGSLWREELTDLPIGVEVTAYGTHSAKPIIDGSDVAENASFRKTAGLAHVYEIAWTHDFGPDNGKTAHRVWENDFRLRRVQDLSACDAIPGSFYAEPPTEGGPDTIYVHASDSSDPSTNGFEYELTRRRWAVQLYEHTRHASVRSLHTRRNAHADGSLVVDGRVSDCLAEDGRVHNVFIRGTAEDTVAWKIEPPPHFGGATMFVSFEGNRDVDRVTYRRCTAIADGPALGPTGGTNAHLTLGFYGHTTRGWKFGTAVYEQCAASGVQQAFGFQNLDNALYYMCRSTDARVAISTLAEHTLAVLGGTFKADMDNASVVRFDTDYGRPARIIIRGVRSIQQGRYTKPIWIDRADGRIEISRSTFITADGILWLANGAFVVNSNIFYGSNYVLRVGSSVVDYRADENLYFNTRGIPTGFQVDTSNILGVPAWQSTTGQDLSSLEADPLFVGEPHMGEFGVAADSPARALSAGADYEGEGADAVLQAYRTALLVGFEP